MQTIITLDRQPGSRVPDVTLRFKSPYEAIVALLPRLTFIELASLDVEVDAILNERPLPQHELGGEGG